MHISRGEVNGKRHANRVYGEGFVQVHVSWACVQTLRCTNSTALPTVFSNDAFVLLVVEHCLCSIQDSVANRICVS